ncbi:MAG: hypothetical protein C5B54_02175 [Acidobacteria bacterium]|nr:MAG: hypothetical protein C5B54_02175 [Acidobacteriota bacterium]
MKELVQCWQHTRMIVLIGFCAAMFIAALLPTKPVTIIPGITEIRPGAVVPIVLSIFFGPAAAWGAAFGNTIGDVMGGTISPGTLFGFFGNLVYAYVPYRVFRMAGILPDDRPSAKFWGALFFSILLASGLCAGIISTGADAVGVAPLVLLWHAIFLNNSIFSIILAPVLILFLRKRIWQMKLSYLQVMQPEEISMPFLRLAGPLLVLFLVIAAYVLLIVSGLPATFAVKNMKAFELIVSVSLTLAALLFL